MATGNFLTDMGLAEPTTKPDNFLAYMNGLENVSTPSLNIPQTVEQEVDFASYGLQNMDEYQIMVDVKSQGGTSDDFREILAQYRVDQENATKAFKPEDLEGFDIGVQAGTALSEFGRDFKFQSEVDDNVVESGLKFLGNLPGNTVQLAGDIISLLSNPIGTAKSVGDLAKAGVESGLNKTFSTEAGQSLLRSLGAPEENLRKIREEGMFSSDEVSQISEAVGGELSRLGDEGRIKELLVENPADVLLTFMGGASIAKNAAKTKGLTNLANKLQTVENALNPIKIQAEALKTVGRGFTKIADLTPNLSEKLIDTTLKLTPSQTKKIKASTLGKDTTPSQWLLQKGIIDDTATLRGREGLVTKLQDFNQKSFDELNNTVAKVDGLFKNETVDKGIDALVKEFDNVPGMEDKFNSIKQLQAKSRRGEGLTLSEVLNVKREMDKALDLFGITGDIKAGARKEGLANIRSGIREFIETQADAKGLPDIKKLSNDVRVSRQIKDSLIDRIDAAGSNRIFGLTDFLVGGGAFAGLDAGLAIALVAGKKLIESPAFKLAAVKTLKIPQKVVNKIGTAKKLTSKEALALGNALQQFITEKGARIVDDLADQLGVRSKFLDDAGRRVEDFDDITPKKTIEQLIEDRVELNRKLDRLEFSDKKDVDFDFQIDELRDELQKNQLQIEELQGFNQAGAAKSAEVSELVDKLKTDTTKTIGYHGTNADFDKFLNEMIGKGATSKFGEGVYLSSSPDVAKTYADLMSGLKGGKPRLIEAIIPEDFNIQVYDGPLSGLKEASDAARKAGFKGIKYNTDSDFIQIPGLRKIDTTGHNNYIIFNPDDAKIIKNKAIKDIGIVNGLGLLRNLLTGGIVAGNTTLAGLMIKDKFFPGEEDTEILSAGEITPRN